MWLTAGQCQLQRLARPEQLPLAYNFLRNFAKDNDLQVEVLPDDYFF